MLQTLRGTFGLLTLIAMLVAACASTELTSSWKDPKYQKRPVRYMIISVDDNPTTRQYFEDKFAEQIKARGTEAIASYTVLPESRQEDPAGIAAKVAELKIEAVLITRLLSKNITQGRAPKTLYNPAPNSPKWQDYYGYDNTSIYPPGVIADEAVAVIETKIYEAANFKMIWSASSKSEVGGPYQQHIDGYIATMMKAMVKQGLLGR